ncbi:MAG: DUF6051 family protein [Ignavibacteria bacterium]
MNYYNDYNFLKDIYHTSIPEIEIPAYNIRIRNFVFNSPPTLSIDNLEQQIKQINIIQKKIQSLFPVNNSNEIHSLRIFSKPDLEIKENYKFVYPIYERLNNRNKSDSVVIILHGLNERSWDKYHSWANYIVTETGIPVILFPIAMHINRSPVLWRMSREMNAISKERKNLFSQLEESSFVNAAISTRLTFNPIVFFWSGVRTYFDIISLLGYLKSGRHPLFEKNPRCYFLGYSIGAFITQILYLVNPSGWFEEIKSVLFCGGCTFDKMNPSSRYIYDTKTFEVMRDFYLNNFETQTLNDKYLSRFFEEYKDEANAFLLMLHFEKNAAERGRIWNRFKNLILTISLQKDEVIPTHWTQLTMTDNLKIPGAKFLSLDFPFDYSHVTPFPLLGNIQEMVDEAFSQVFGRIVEFYLNS